MSDKQNREKILALLVTKLDLASSSRLEPLYQQASQSDGIALGQLLVGEKLITPEDLELLNKLVDYLLKRHSGNTTACVDALLVSERIEFLKTNNDLLATAKMGESRDVDNEQTKSWRLAVDDPQGRYQIIRDFAEGGLGKISIAIDRDFHREVAVKEIKPTASKTPDAVGRFRTEAKVTGSLEHPGIVPVYSLGENPDGQPQYVMRLIRGKTLKQAIQDFHEKFSNKRRTEEYNLELRKLLRALISVCDALDYAHSRGVVHRDVKPANIMLGRFGETLVVDWGIAKLKAERAKPLQKEESLVSHATQDNSNETSQGSLVGTPNYMSPEQARGDIPLIGPATDVYSVGATLFTILTGEIPHAGTSRADVLKRILSGDIKQPRDFDKRIPQALNAICRKAMAREIDARYSKPGELAADLERWLAGEPTTAYLEPITTKLVRAAKRNRAVVTGTTVALLAVLTWFIVGDYYVRRERDIAKANLSIAQDTIDRFMLEMGDEGLSHIPEINGLRLRMVNESLKQYEQLLENQPSDVATKFKTVDANLHAALLLRLTRQFAKSEERLRTANGLLDEVAQIEGNDRVFFKRLSVQFEHAMLADSMGSPQDSIKSLLQSIEQIESYKPRSKGDHYFAEGKCCWMLAELLLQKGDVGLAKRYSQTAYQVVPSLRRGSPDNLSLCLLEPRVWVIASRCEFESGNNALAEQFLKNAEESLNLSDPVVSKIFALEKGQVHPLIASVRVECASIRALLAKGKDDSTFTAALQRELDLAKELFDRFPNRDSYKVMYLEAKFRQADWNRRQSNWAEIRSSFQELQPIVDSLANDWRHLSITSSLTSLRLNDPEISGEEKATLEKRLAEIEEKKLRLWGVEGLPPNVPIID